MAMLSPKPANYYIPKPIPSGGNRYSLPIVQPMPGKAPIKFGLPVMPSPIFKPSRGK